MSLRAMRGSGRSTFKGKRCILESSCSNTFCSYVFSSVSESGLSGKSWDVLCVHKSSIGDKGLRHGTGGTTGVWTFYQRRVVPGLSWMVLSLQGFSEREHWGCMGRLQVVEHW